MLAYNIVLSFSALYVSRDVLLKGMDVAAVVAAKNSDLASLFLSSNRMPELVDSLAQLSTSILKAEELGTRSGKRSTTKLSLWSIKKAMIIAK